MEGDSEALEALCARWRTRVLRFARSRLRSLADAEDVTQEVFAELARSLRQYGGRSRFGTWLLGIAHHRVCRARRRSRRAIIVPLDEIASRPMVSFEGERRLDVARALARCRAALRSRATPDRPHAPWLVHGEGRSTTEAARALCLSPAAVRVQICRTRKALRAATPGLAEVIES